MSVQANLGKALDFGGFLFPVAENACFAAKGGNQNFEIERTRNW